MLAGPTVRRMRRERAAGQAGPERYKRNHSRRSTMAPVVVETAPRPAPPPPVPAWPSTSGLPFCMASLLGTHGDVAVIDDQILKITPRHPKPGEDWVEINRCRRAIQVCGALKARVQRSFGLYRQALEQWALGRSPAAGYAALDRSIGLVNMAPDYALEEFIIDRLIPRLEREAGVEDGTFRLSMPDLQVDNAAVENVSTAPQAVVPTRLTDAMLDVEFSQDIAFSGNSYYTLSPFYGRVRAGQFHLRWGGREFVGPTREHRFRALERYDRFLETTIAQVLAPLVQQGVQEQKVEQESRECVLYDDGKHAVVRSPAGQLFVCRHLPEYVVEGSDRRLFHFEPVQLGVHLSALGSGHFPGPQVMHPYRHMFVMGTQAGEFICMPRDGKYYGQLRRLPLEDAFIAHLESARLTMCSGYFHNNGTCPYHQVELLGKPQLSPTEVRQRGLPLYRYYRNPEQGKMK